MLRRLTKKLFDDGAADATAGAGDEGVEAFDR